MKNFLSSLLATILGILIITVAGILILTGIIAASTAKEVPDVEENSILVARFNGPIPDRADDNPISRLFSGTPVGTEVLGLNQILKTVEKAKGDENIEGIFLNLTSVPAGATMIGEVRNALSDFKESGKFVYAYADNYTQGTYYLASVADSVFMTPEGMFLFSGLNAELTFFKDALDKLGVDVQVIKHGSYKSAMETLTRESLSDENREQIEGYITAIWGKMVSDIAESRGISVEALNRMADNLSSLEPSKLMESGMIDGLIYYDEMLSLLKKKTGVEEDDDLESVRITRYKDVPVKENKEFTRDKVAVVYGMGMVLDGDAPEGYIGSERIARAIRKARKDESVKAIVFRINSGGGSVTASDVIYREMMLAAREKPVVASMGSVAASGGYYIAAPADTILASSSTITGSIGVIFALPNMEELLNEKLGITIDGVRTNEHSDIFSVSDPLDPEERAIIQNMVDKSYESFVNLVAENRGMSFEEVDAIAGGRVWSGEDALELGLIDLIGGLDRSIAVAAEMAGLDNYRLQSLPVIEDPFTMLMRELSGGAVKKAVRRELGSDYELYRKIRDIRHIEGLQAIMPYDIEVR